MKGGIYSDQRCSVCGGSFTHYEPRGLWCKDHPGNTPTRFVVRFGGLTKRFKDYDSAYRFLTGIRYETDQGKYDVRDYQRENPLGFENLTRKFLHAKRKNKAVKKYEQRLRFAVEQWQNRNVKEIGFGEIEDLLNDLIERGYSSYYVHHVNNVLKTFWRWILDRDEINILQFPKFPKVKYSIAFRKIVSKENQEKILEEIYRQTWEFNPRIYIGVMFLATYINLRPHELRHIKEKDIELDNQRILITETKEGPEKYVFLLPEDVELLRSIPRGFPELYFFRHLKGNGNAKPGDQFGRDYLYKWWRSACENLKIEGVPLYPGTRHSTEVDLRSKGHSPESIWRAAGTKSNKARERYLLVTGSELKGLYQDARTQGGRKVIDLKKHSKADNGKA